MTSPDTTSTAFPEIRQAREVGTGKALHKQKPSALLHSLLGQTAIMVPSYRPLGHPIQACLLQNPSSNVLNSKHQCLTFFVSPEEILSVSLHSTISLLTPDVLWGMSTSPARTGVVLTSLSLATPSSHFSQFSHHWPACISRSVSCATRMFIPLPRVVVSLIKDANRKTQE